MKTIKLLAISSLLALGAVACGDDDGPAMIDAAATFDAPPTIDSAVPMPDAGPPPKPTPGTRIDRMGRPAINTALNHTFDGNAATKGAAKDAYNAAATTDWQTFVPEFRVNQGILDSLDANCGNALAADLAPTRYAGIAGVLADDQLYVNTASVTCGVYLAVEANATGLISNMNCGGRSLTDDVIETSYSVLATSGISGVDDTIAANDVAFQATFPYLAAPH